MRKIKFQRPPVIASTCALVSLGILLGLGNWQIHRYTSKAIYQSEICTQETVSPLSLDFTGQQEGTLGFCPDKALFQGVFDPDFDLSIGPRVQGGNPGYHIYRLLKGTDGSAILVNLGWSAIEKPPLKPSTDTYTITGSLLKPGKPGMLSIPNRPGEDIWTTLDTAQIKDYFKLQNTAPYVLVTKDAEPKLPEYLEPAEMATSYLTPWMHLQYAFFWFSMAIALSVIFLLRFVIKKA